MVLLSCFEVVITIAGDLAVIAILGIVTILLFVLVDAMLSSCGCR